MLKDAKAMATAAASLVTGGCTMGVTGCAGRVLPPAAQQWDSPAAAVLLGRLQARSLGSCRLSFLREVFARTAVRAADGWDHTRWSGPAGNHGNTRGVSALSGEHDGAPVARGAFGGPWGTQVALCSSLGA